MGLLTPSTVFKQIPGIQPYIDNLASFDPGKGAVWKADKKLIKRFNAGDDVSSYGQFNTIRQGAAAERRGIEDNYMTGANALLASTGGDQAGLLNRMRDIELDKSREREGMNLTSGLTDLYDSTANRFQQARQNRSAQMLQAQQGALSGKLNSGQFVQEGGFLGKLLGSAVQGAAGALTGGLGGGGGLSALFKKSVPYSNGG